MSVTDIWNQALAAVGTRSSVAAQNEASKEAQACLLFYDTVRTSVLRAAHWGFAKRSVSLGLLKAFPGTPENTSTPGNSWSPVYPAPAWTYSYARPPDCIAVRKVMWQAVQNDYFAVPLMGNMVNPSQGVCLPVRYELGTDVDANGNNVNVILTNAPSALLEYTQDIIDPLLWDSIFSDAIINALGAAICVQLTGDVKRKRELQDDANNAIIQARVSNANEEIDVHNIPPEMLRARGDYCPGTAAYGPLLRL
jgi:hypothetical protein